MGIQTKLYVTQNTDSDSVAICKNKVTLTLNKLAYNRRLLFTNIDSLMYTLKLKMSIKILATIKKCLTLAIIPLSQNITIIQTNKWFVKLKMKQLVL